MVAGFNRSFSFPSSPRLTKKSHHVRSVSLPAGSSQLEDQIRSVNSWIHSSQSEPECTSTSTSTSSSFGWICDGLARLESLHNSLMEQGSFGRYGSSSKWTDQILNAFLRFADAHGSLRSEMMAMDEIRSDAQIAVRRKDSIAVESCTKSMKKIEKRLKKITSLLREFSKPSLLLVEEVELAVVIREVIEVTVAASAKIFLGITSVLSAVSAVLVIKNSFLRLKKSTKIEDDYWSNVTEKLQLLENCIVAVETRSERVFRCFVNSRVSLLSAFAPSL